MDGNSTTQSFRRVAVVLSYECARLLPRALDRIPAGTFDAVLVADDGSSDAEESRAVAESRRAHFLTHPHLGYGGNLRFGLAEAVRLGAASVVEIHGDGQFDPAASAVAARAVENGAEFVMGSRFGRRTQPLLDGMPLVRWGANIALSAVARAVLGAPLTEYHGGLRAYGRSFARRLCAADTSDDYLFSFEAVALACFDRRPVAEVPVRCDYRSDHTSISLRKSALYALRTFGVLFAFVRARAGASTKLFSSRV